MRLRMLTVLGWLALLLGACGGDSAPDNTAPAFPTHTVSPVAGRLLLDYESLRASQQAILEVWEGLAANEQVQCGDYPDVIDPETISAHGDTAQESLAERLRSAAINIDHAVNLFENTLPSPVSAFGSGYRRAIKPDLLFSGGRVLYTEPLGTSTDARFEARKLRIAPGNKVASPK